jgi:hypothetical protein
LDRRVVLAAISLLSGMRPRLRRAAESDGNEVGSAPF